MQSSNKISIKNFKFGIELESNLRAYKMVSEMKFEPGWKSHGEHCGSEIVSPILYGYQGVMSVRRQLKHMWKWKEQIMFGDCGLHIHIDIQHFNLGQAKRLVLIASRFDQTLFCMMNGSRWNNNYSRRCGYNEKTIKSAKGLAALQRLQQHGRYCGTNLYAFSKHGTVEFRYAMGSANWEKVYSLLVLYLRMVAAAELTMEVPTVTPVANFGAQNTGLPSPKKSMAVLEKNRDIFFDFLQLKGHIRKSLELMFETNVLDTKGLNQKTTLEITEDRGDVKFSLKRN